MNNREEILNNDYIGYNMMIQALNNKNKMEGIQKTLYLAKVRLEAGDIVLFKMNDNGEYYHYSNQALMNKDSRIMSIVLNKAKNVIEKKEYFKMDSKLNDDILNLTYIPVNFGNSKYIIAITNIFKKIDKNELEFIKILKASMTAILSNLELVDKLKENSIIDSLTGLDNRNHYEQALEEYESNNKPLVYGIFDLFRLKYINDKYGHDIGDMYITKTAKILNHYFPKYYIVKEKNGNSKKIYTGSCIYRIGGDEFALITESESPEMVEAKAKLLKEEVKMLDLGIEENVQLAINYGIDVRTDKKSIKEVSQKADEMLREDKDKMYKELGIDRRQAKS